MMFQTFPPIRFLDIRFRTISRNTEDLVIILRLAPLQRCLRFFQFRSQCANVSISGCALCLRLLNCGLEVGYRGVEFFKMKI